jgi:NADP-dependent 3-hydroxy acid dehydrogenase YdfG
LEIDYVVSEIAKEKDCKKAVEHIVNEYGRIDILFNNAGVLPLEITHETRRLGMRCLI